MADYDILIIGAGPGGYVAAIRAAQLGAKVGVVERAEAGGTCLNIGCIPTKALLESTDVYHRILHSQDFGIVLQGSATVDWQTMQTRKEQIVQRLRKGVELLLSSRSVDLIRGDARIKQKGVVEVGNQEISARNVVIATGSSPGFPPFKGSDICYTSDDLLEIDYVPKSMIIVGAGVVGMEFATLFSTLGTKVLVLELLDRILMPLDIEAATMFQRYAQRSGIDIKLKANVQSVEESGDGYKVEYSHNGQQYTDYADVVLVAAGRLPVTEGIGLESIGVETQKGFIRVNKKLQTNVENTYAIGDVNGLMMLAHAASYQGEVAVANALGGDLTYDLSSVPACIYTNPEIAYVGLSEEKAAERYGDIKVGKFPLTANGRSMILGNTNGFAKIIAAPDGKVVGVVLMGPRATDMIAEAAVCIKHGISAKELSEVVHPHPTVSEVIMEAAMDVSGMAIHIPPRARTY